MKYFSTAIYLAIIISVFTGCKKDNDKTGFNYILAAGVWTPYEVTDEFGTVHPGPFTANNLFGSYAESVQLKSNKTFVPVTWADNDHVTFKTDEAGTFEYLPGNKLKLKGLWEMEWEIIKLEGDNLWLKMYSTSGNLLYKFRRQQ